MNGLCVESVKSQNENWGSKYYEGSVLSVSNIVSEPNNDYQNDITKGKENNNEYIFQNYNTPNDNNNNKYVGQNNNTNGNGSDNECNTENIDILIRKKKKKNII